MSILVSLGYVFLYEIVNIWLVVGEEGTTRTCRLDSMWEGGVRVKLASRGRSNARQRRYLIEFVILICDCLKRL